MDDASYRVSDAEREQTVVMLRDHLLAGRLTLEEFTERVSSALGARVGADLARVQQDLPTAPAHWRHKPARFAAALFGHVVCRGRLRLRGRALAVSMFGDLDFDLREATIDAPQTTLTVVALFGNADIYVPEGLNVDVTGLSAVGHRRDWGQDVVTPGAPAVTVRVIGVVGTVDVWRVPPDLGDDYGEIMRHLQGRPRRALS